MFGHFVILMVLMSQFYPGTLLVALVEKLQKRRLRHNKKPQNQHHEIENITIALDAIKEDGIKLVNIGRDKSIRNETNNLLNIKIFHN